MYMNNIKGITYFEEDREPTPDNPNNIISIGVDERVANYIDRLVRKLEEKDKEIERLNNIIKTKDEGIKALTEDLCETTEELEKTKSILKEALDKLTIKQIRFINEKDYVLDDNDLDEIMKILDKGV